MKVTYGAIVQGASGRFGGTVHSNWKGVQVVRRFAKPSNPDSQDQQVVRTIFRNLTRLYAVAPTYTKGSWASWVVGKPMIARNKLIGVNVPLLQPVTDWSGFQPTPGDSSALPPTGFTPTGGVEQITTSVLAPTAPTGWSISQAVACAINATADPTGGVLSATDCQVYEQSDLSSPYAPTIADLPAGDYFTWAFLVWEAPDGTPRYSAPLSGGAAVTVT